MGSQLLQNTEIIKQTDVLLWKIWRKYGSVFYLFSCNNNNFECWTWKKCSRNQTAANILFIFISRISQVTLDCIAKSIASQSIAKYDSTCDGSQAGICVKYFLSFPQKNLSPEITETNYTVVRPALWICGEKPCAFHIRSLPSNYTG